MIWKEGKAGAGQHVPGTWARLLEPSTDAPDNLLEFVSLPEVSFVRQKWMWSVSALDVKLKYFEFDCENNLLRAAVGTAAPPVAFINLSHAGGLGSVSEKADHSKC